MIRQYSWVHSYQVYFSKEKQNYHEIGTNTCLITLKNNMNCFYSIHHMWKFLFRISILMLNWTMNWFILLVCNVGNENDYSTYMSSFLSAIYFLLYRKKNSCVAKMTTASLSLSFVTKKEKKEKKVDGCTMIGLLRSSYSSLCHC